MLSLVSIIELLKEVERDEGIHTIEFPCFYHRYGRASNIARELASHVDSDTLEWIGPPVQIVLTYEDNDGSSPRTSFSASRSFSAPTLKECAKALEKLLCDDLLSSLHERRSFSSSIVGNSTTSKLMIDESFTETTETSGNGEDGLVLVRRLSTQ